MFQKTSSCFANQMFYVRNILIRSYTMDKITFIITTITNILIIIIIITIIIKFTIVIIVIFSFDLHFFDIRSSCVTLMFEFIWVFLTTCFLLFICFRCNILLANISIDLLLLALVFFWKILVLSIKICYNFNCRLVLHLYIHFQSLEHNTKVTF